MMKTSTAAGKLRRALRHARMELRVQVGRRPRLYMAGRKLLKRLGWPGGQFLHGGTDIVIDGFPRSGNSFAVEAFRLAQDRPLAIANHSHSPAQVIAGVRAGIPVMVLVRRPEDAILSAVLRTPARGLRQTAREYAIFYETIEPVLDRVVMAPFDVVIRDMGRVIDAINEKFGCEFSRFEHTPENEEACFVRIEQAHARHHGGNVREEKVARPSAERSRRKEELREHYRSLPARLRARVARQHEAMMERALQ